MQIRPFLSSILLSVIILVVLSGCDTRFKAEELLTQYVNDLNRSQYVSITAPVIEMPISLPSSRYRHQALSDFDIGILDFLSLQQCDVGIVAGRKNSILGKVMLDSQRFLYELDIIRAIESCSIENESLSKTLRKVAQKKRIELSKAYGNAILNGMESEAFFSLSNGLLPLDYSTADQQELMDALNRLVVIGEGLQQLPVIDPSTFENDLKTLMDSEYAGRLLYTLSRISGHLDQVAANVGVLDDTVCGTPMVFLNKQFETHYIKQIQPYMGRINRTVYDVLPLLNRLFELSEPLTVEMKRFANQFDLRKDSGEWQRYQRASQHHAKAWSSLLSRCSITIGGVS